MSYSTGTEHLLCAIDDGVATFTLNRPEKKNALGSELTPALRQGLLDLELRTDVRCIMITGAGNASASSTASTRTRAFASTLSTSPGRSRTGRRHRSA